MGIAHGGIIVSAAVRLFRMEVFAPNARIAELLTLAGLANAGMYIIIHLGRPDRVVTSILPNLPQTIQTSPLAWDVIVITLYFVLTATYLTLTLRHVLYVLRERLARTFSPLYRLVLVGYRRSERKKAERMAWWLALGLIILAPSFLHGGVIPWLFALLPGQPGWFGPVQGPQFLAAALASALGAVTLGARGGGGVMTEGAIGPILIFGIVLSPVYLMLAGWLFGRPRELRLPLIGLGYLAGFTVLAWGGMAVFALAVRLLYFP